MKINALATYQMHQFIDKKEKKYVEYIYNDKYLYELKHETKDKTSKITGGKVLYIGSLMKTIKHYNSTADLEAKIMQYFQQQEFEMNEGRKSGIKIIKGQKYLNSILPN